MPRLVSSSFVCCVDLNRSEVGTTCMYVLLPLIAFGLAICRFGLFVFCLEARFCSGSRSRSRSRSSNQCH